MTTSVEIESALRRRGLRVTPQRALVFRLVQEMGADHPSAEAIHIRATRQMPSLSLRTVYAILGELEEMKAIRSLDLGTGSRRFCVNPRRHHHLVCTRCGKIKDVFAVVDFVELPPDQRQGFVITEQDVVFRGLCRECRA
ncbi:MAG: Fur family transcriptional regulator [Armatimonadota bacterium]|nr:Fur family transcriptional regulator [Armatimonadota bacterium]MDR7451885.1 Fur family transcriptional regulator [Armatimonadota bacterium]MDR7467610.1 Fur family transcriptional regulator [Armatimonadota bacterium]MDR7494429.1 Fur family transcriptional regulator [Armatimonadota bacterium]MDR7500409.1 Fur family transcriptional regulator [Armatimonadota bacterium]